MIISISQEHLIKNCRQDHYALSKNANKLQLLQLLQFFKDN